MDKRQGLGGQDVARDDEEGRDSIVSTSEEVADYRIGREQVLIHVPEARLDKAASNSAMGPEFVVMPVNEEGGESAEAIEVGRRSEFRWRFFGLRWIGGVRRGGFEGHENRSHGAAKGDDECERGLHREFGETPADARHWC